MTCIEKSIFYSQIKKISKKNKNIILHDTLPSLAPLIYKSDLAIGAAGSNTWERCCLALPSIIVISGFNQKKIAYGSKGFPWNSEICQRQINYKKGICPIAEDLHDNKLIIFEMCLFKLDKREIDLVIKSFRKVWKNLSKLRNINEK